MVDTPDGGARLSEASPASRIDRLCDDFEAAWEAGREPRLRDYFVALSHGGDERAVRHLLIELVKIDMYHRWLRVVPKSDTAPGSEAATRLGQAADSADELPSRPRVRDYALRFPTLGSPDELPEDLLEFEARLQAGWEPTRDCRHREGGRTFSCGQFAGTERFAVQRRVGAGGMGIVYQVYDRERDEVVALKTLRQLEPTALYYLKREFRSLANLSHPHLARLHELFSIEGQWFFTMEFIEGLDFLNFVRSAPRPFGPAADLATWGTSPLVQETSEAGSGEGGSVPAAEAFPTASQPVAVLSEEQLARLRAALKQLAEGVTALHRAGKLHRDIKPSNVLVTPAGRVVLLDFGLSMELDETTTGNYVVGTAAYMSPEQGVAGPLSPASDWYSVGVMLYEALTGRLPFQGPPLQLLLSKRESDPPAPRELWAGVPDDLNTLCMAALQREPAARPSGEEILRLLGDMAASAPAQEVPRRIPFVGRDVETRLMNEALAAVKRGGTEVVYVRGRSGVGKTALVQQFLATARQAHKAVILAGRCYERESVPFKALDSLVDALSHYLMGLAQLEVDALLPRDVVALSQSFPVLERVAAVAQAILRAAATPDRRELRDRAFRALRELLTRLGDRSTLILHIDDLQWGDLDSAALLNELLSPPDPPVLLLLLCCRSEDAATSPVMPHLLPSERGGTAPIQVRSIDLEPLPFPAARDLAQAILREHGRERETLSDAIAIESGGNPYFLGALASRVRQSADGIGAPRAAGTIRLDDMLWEWISQLPEPSRRLLEVVAIAGHPLREKDALEAARIASDGQLALHPLRAASLIRTTAVEAHEGIETYHDRVREVVVSRLGASVRADWHGKLARTLDRNRTADPATLAHHYDSAGQYSQAGEWFAVAADEAARLLAFDRAVTMYQLALARLSPAESQTRDLTRKLADALANAGRGAEAARQYLAAAEAAPAEQAVVFRRHAATQFLTSGYVREGLEALRSVLGTVGTRLPSARFALLPLVYRRVLVLLRGLEFRSRQADQVPEELLTKIDIFWSASIGLSMIDHVRAADLQARCLLLSLRAGVPSLVARSLCLEAAHVAASGGPGEHRANRLLDRAETLARPLDNPYLAGLRSLSRGICAYFCGRWRAAIEHCRDAETTFRDHCTGVTWELDTAIGFGLAARSFAGDVRELAARLPFVLAEAGKRGDVYSTVYNGTITLPALAAADPERAEQTVRQWHREDFQVQRFDELVAQLEIDLYCGRGETAWNRIHGQWPALARSFLFHVQFLRGCASFARARSALAAARCRANPAPLLRVAGRDARRLASEGQPWTTALAEIIRAGIDSFRRDSAPACERLENAARLFDAADMPLYALAATRRRGELLGGEAGNRLLSHADAAMSNCGVRDSVRMTAVYSPGFPATAPGSGGAGEPNRKHEDVGVRP